MLGLEVFFVVHFVFEINLARHQLEHLILDNVFDLACLYKLTDMLLGVYH